jgi:chemotaxis response regulator CheB
LAKTVLIADDSEIVRKLICRLFKTEADYDLCAEARNGEEAIAPALQHRPDLIVLDLSMPVMNIALALFFSKDGIKERLLVGAKK